MAGTCRVCGEEIVGFPPTHYAQKHPGAKSPAPSHKKKKVPPQPAAAGSAPLSDAAAAGGLDDTGETALQVPDDIETAPVVVKRSWKDRLWGGSRDVSRGTSRETRPSRKRENATDLLGTGWRGLGWAISHSDAPVGRTMQLQAPVAGEVFDELIAGTWVDRGLVQPIARNTENAERVAAVLALPLLVFLFERAPGEGQRAMMPFLEQAALAHISAMAPVLKKKRARDAQLQKTVDELKAEGLIDADVGNAQDAAATILNSIFGFDAQADPSTNGAGVTADAASV